MLNLASKLVLALVLCCGACSEKPKRHGGMPPPPKTYDERLFQPDRYIPRDGSGKPAIPDPVTAPTTEVQTYIGVSESEASENGRRMLLVVNGDSPISRQIGEYYALKRKVPRSHVVIVSATAGEQIAADEYRHAIENPVRAAIKKAVTRIDYIVTTKGVPIRLTDSNGYSLDAFLACMDKDLTPIPQTIDPKAQEEAMKAIQRAVNPYFNSRERFSSSRYQMYLVTRLDGYEWKDIKALIDHALSAKPGYGPFFFDAAANRTGGGYVELQKTLFNANSMLKAKGFQSSIDEGEKFVAPDTPLLGYASWGSNDGKFDLGTYKKLRFKPGAIVETFVSTSGRTFNRTSGGQSLIADLIENGVTGVKGYVSEPYTIALARADILFDRYTRGWNLAESFYAASPLIKWKDVVIGDPFCAPFADWAPQTGPARRR